MNTEFITKNGESPSDPSEIFFAGVYGYRSWSNAIGVVIAGGMGGTFVFLSVALVFRRLRMNYVQEDDVLRTISCILFFTAGLYLLYLTTDLLWKMLMDIKNTFCIDARGIKDGGREWRWEQIRYIGALYYHLTRGLGLRIGVKRGIDRPICSGRTLEQHEYQELLDRLAPFLEKNYPDIVVG